MIPPTPTAMNTSGISPKSSSHRLPRRNALSEGDDAFT